jgi:hypothetical protein
VSDNVFTKAERLVAVGLNLLTRETVMARAVWRDAAGDFRGAKGDTITIRLPAYAVANKRTLRAGTTRQKSALLERAVNVTLTDNLYHVVPVTDEELTLDIESFAVQVVAPQTAAIARGIEDEIITEAQGADYQYHLELDRTNPHKTFFRSRRHLNDARVPQQGRTIAVGSAVEEILLTSEQFIRADVSGSTDAFRQAVIGRLAGDPVIAVPGLDPEEAYHFHRTAYVLNSRAPFVPQGAPYGATASEDGFAIRLVQAIDPDEVVDNAHADVFVGTNHVTDVGEIDSDGTFTPAEDPNDSGAQTYFLRAVKVDFDGPES